MVHKIYLYKKEDHLGNRNKMRSATEKPEATLLTTEYLEDRPQRWNCWMHGDKMTSQSWLRCSENISNGNNSLKTCFKSKRSTNSARNHNNYSRTWSTQISSNFARILKNINILIAMPSPKLESFIAVAAEIWSTRGVLRFYFNPWLCHEEPVEDQNMVLLKDRWCSSRRSKCLRKQDKRNMEAILRYFQDGTNKKIIEVIGGAQHWRKGNHAFRSHRSWKTRLHSYESWTAAERQTLDSSFEC